jgi:hypothetical protein
MVSPRKTYACLFSGGNISEKIDNLRLKIEKSVASLYTVFSNPISIGFSAKLTVFQE